jgi:Protein of unknown function (DUF3089)
VIPLRSGAAVGLALCLAAGAAMAPASVGSASAPASAAAAQPAETVWLCRPGLPDNPCESDLTSTVVRPDGSQRVRQASPAKKPPVDCFYVYPTVSAQSTTNANLNVDPELIAVAETQASRFSQVCRVYAPVYPQLTVAAIGGGASPDARETAYAGVLAAWKEYLERYNRGRGVVFLGHSQGTGMLVRLLASEVDPSAKLRRRTVSALLLGGNVTVAKGKKVGGDFQHLPACQSNDQTGCVVAYSMFAETPPPNAGFGRVGTGPRTGSTQDPSALQVLCVNPASLKGTGKLEAYARTSRFPGPIGAVAPAPPSAPTPWVEYPDRYSARCEQNNEYDWLQVTSIGGPDAAPPPGGSLPPTWGLHLGDVNLALGNLVDLARQQAASYRR